MSRTDFFTEAHVCYICLNFNSKRLADERDKKKFLDLVLRRQKKEGIRLYAFAVLDNGVRLAAGLPRPLDEEQNGTIPAWLSDCFPPDGEIPQMTARRIDTMEELLQICIRIHFSPVEEGYVKFAGDYWWSSLRTYRGTYLWENVNVFPLLRFLGGGDVEGGRRRFIRLHLGEEETQTLS